MANWFQTLASTLIAPRFGVALSPFPPRRNSFCLHCGVLRHILSSLHILSSASNCAGVTLHILSSVSKCAGDDKMWRNSGESHTFNAGAGPYVNYWLDLRFHYTLGKTALQYALEMISISSRPTWFQSLHWGVTLGRMLKRIIWIPQN